MISQSSLAVELSCVDKEIITMIYVKEYGIYGIGCKASCIELLSTEFFKLPAWRFRPRCLGMRGLVRGLTRQLPASQVSLPGYLYRTSTVTRHSCPHALSLCINRDESRLVERTVVVAFSVVAVVYHHGGGQEGYSLKPPSLLCSLGLSGQAWK